MLVRRNNAEQNGSNGPEKVPHESPEVLRKATIVKLVKKLVCFSLERNAPHESGQLEFQPLPIAVRPYGCSTPGLCTTC